MLIEIKKNLLQFSLFALVGITTLLIDIFVTTTLYNVFSVAPFIASAVGFCSGFFFNFPVNRHKVFKHSEHDKFSLKIQITLVLVLSTFNLVFTSFVTQILVTHNVLQISIAKVLLTVIIAIWNFFILRFFVFAKN